MRAVRWLGYGLAGLVVAIASIWAMGSRLPVAHRAAVTSTLDADPDAVWRRIDRIEEWPTWQDVTVELLGGDSVRVRQAGETLLYRVDRSRPRTLITEIATPGLPFGGRWTWSVDSTASGRAAVTIVEDGEVYDPIFRFFSRYVFGHDSTIRTVMDALEESFEPTTVDPS